MSFLFAYLQRAADYLTQPLADTDETDIPAPNPADVFLVHATLKEHLTLRRLGALLTEQYAFKALPTKADTAEATWRANGLGGPLTVIANLSERGEIIITLGGEFSFKTLFDRHALTQRVVRRTDDPEELNIYLDAHSENHRDFDIRQPILDLLAGKCTIRGMTEPERGVPERPYITLGWDKISSPLIS